MEEGWQLCNLPGQWFFFLLSACCARIVTCYGLTGNGAKIWTGDEKSLVEVRPKQQIFSDVACFSACLMVRGVEIGSHVVVFLGR